WIYVYRPMGCGGS
nr:Chain E, peptide [Mus musculus]